MDSSDGMAGPMATGVTRDAWDPKALIAMIPDLKLRKARSFSSWNPHGGTTESEYGKSTRVVKNNAPTRRAISGGHLENRPAVSSPESSEPEHDEGSTPPAPAAMKSKTLQSTLNNTHESNLNASDEEVDKSEDSSVIMSREATPEPNNSLLVQSTSLCSRPDASRMDCVLDATIDKQCNMAGYSAILENSTCGIFKSASESDMLRYQLSRVEEPSDVDMIYYAEEGVAHISPTGYPSPPDSEDGHDDADDDGLGDKSLISDTPYQHPIFETQPRLPSPPLSDTDVIRTIPKPEFPIRVNNDGPRIFSLEAQRCIMRWRQTEPCDDVHMPVWLVEPDITCIKDITKPYLQLLGCESDDILVEYLDEGSWHKVYTISTKNCKTSKLTHYVLRVALPVDPYYKIESEVATTEIVRHSTNVPVPIIYAYDSSTKNKLGLEWMLMERVTGEPLSNVWSGMTLDSKHSITKRIADWIKQLSTIASDKIGGIYMRYTETQVEFYVGRCVTQPLYRDSRLSYNVHRGPFESVHDFYQTVLALTEYEMDDLVVRLASQSLSGSEMSLDYAPDPPPVDSANDVSRDLTTNERIYAQADKDDEEDFREWPQVDPDYPMSKVREGVTKLRSSLRAICDRAVQPLGKLETLLTHGDLSSDNIFVDKAGTPIALLDWENNPIAPPIFFKRFPDFLESLEVLSMPDVPIKVDTGNFETIEDAEECDQLHERRYIEKVANFQSTQLRVAYQAEFEETEPHLSRAAQNDFSDIEIDIHDRIMNITEDPLGHVRWVDDHLNRKADQAEENANTDLDQNLDTVMADGDELDRLEKPSDISVSQQQDNAVMDEAEDMSEHTLVEEDKSSETEDGHSDDTLAEISSIEEKDKVVDKIQGRDDVVIVDESSGIGESIDWKEETC